MQGDLIFDVDNIKFTQAEFSKIQDYMMEHSINLNTLFRRWIREGYRRHIEKEGK